jgi:hypothetical protein
MTTPWDKMAPGRYATSYLGHTLEVILNPDFPALDNRRYLAVVDHKPLEAKSWLNGAKTACIQHVQKISRGQRSAAPDFIGLANGTVLEVDRPEPEPDQSEPEPDQSEEVLDLSEIVEPPPEPEPEPVTVQVDETGRFAITGWITDQDKVRAYGTIQAVVEMLREHAEVECTITLPAVLKL